MGNWTADQIMAACAVLAIALPILWCVVKGFWNLMWDVRLIRMHADSAAEKLPKHDELHREHQRRFEIHEGRLDGHDRDIDELRGP